MNGVSTSLVIETVEINEPFANPAIGFPLFYSSTLNQGRHE